MYWPIYILNAFEVLACIIGFYSLKRLKNTHWFVFPFYLLVIVLTEFAAEYFSIVKGNFKINTCIYAYFGIPLQFLFFFWIFFKENDKPYKKWPLIASVIYLGSLWADLLYLSKAKVFFASFSYSMGNILLLILVIMFFIKIIKSDEILHAKTNIMFWVCLGLIIFYLGTMPFYGLRNTLYEQLPDFFSFYRYGTFLLNYIMYGSFIMAFVWGRPRFKLS